MTHASRSIGFGRAAIVVATGLGIAAIVVGIVDGDPPPTSSSTQEVNKAADRESGGSPSQAKLGATEVRVRPPAEFVEKGITWLVKAQHPDGGWGAGSHADQQVRDPHAVMVDPATTAFVASALLRNGNTPVEGQYKDNVRRATEFLCASVEEYTKSGPKITDLTGTQIQAKLGPLVDTAMTAQYLARVLPSVPKSDPLRKRIDGALEKCIAKLHDSQQKDGSWNGGGGWASVLQSSLGCSALEYAHAAGKPVDRDRLAKAQKYQLGNFDARSGQVKTEAAAGVALYSYNSSLRGNAAKSRAADDFIVAAKKAGKLAADEPVSVENLKKAGVQPQQAEELFAANANVSSQVATLNGGNSYTGGTIASSGTLTISGVAGAGAGAPVGGPVAAGRPATITASAGEVAAATPPGGSFSKVGAGTLVVTSPTSVYAGTDRAASKVEVFSRGGSRVAAPGLVTDDETLLKGFGNNGGEEFLSYMLASESMVIMGEKDWASWYDKMSGRLSKVQSPDGSWTGHHCITSPVFCTAAVVQTMTADRDAPLLAKLAKEAAALAKVEEPKK
jgi:hypothetical protein